MKKLLLSVLSVLMCGMVVTAPVFAEGSPCTCKVIKDGVETTKEGHLMEGAILKDVCDCGGGEGIIAILNFVVNIMTIGIGILAVIGITIVGIQYRTAGGNEEQVRKSKRRLVEIVIGVTAYVLIYALLAWLLPGFKMIGS